MHACVRCGAPVPIDVGLCERCNPLGLRDSSASQVHGIAIGGVVLAVVLLAVFARISVSGIGPFAASASAVSQGNGLAVTLAVTNKGTSVGQTTCRVTDPADRTRLRWRHRSQPADRPQPDPHVHGPRDGARDSSRSPRRRVHRTVTTSLDEAEATEPGPATASAGYAAELAFAVDLAEPAGAVLMDHYERLERIDHKSAKDVVTEADHLSEALILDAIRARYPGDALLAEETGEHKAAAGEPPTSGRGRAWIVDPLDGTVNYANGIPSFCVSIALVVDGRPTVGVIRDPTRSETYAATADGPATLNGRPIHASAKDALIDCVISMVLNGRTATTRTRNVRAGPGHALDGFGGPRARLCFEWPVRCLHPAGRAIGLGRGRSGPHRGARRRDGDLDGRRRMVRPRPPFEVDRHPGRAAGPPRRAPRVDALRHAFRR